MTRRYVLLFVAALAAAALASALGKTRSRVSETQPAAPIIARAVAVEIRADGVVTRPAAVAVGERLTLSIVNRTGRAARVSLSAYEDRVVIPVLAPDSTWHGEVIADRPGEALAWLIDGEPRGRFDVTGSHLPEGHR